MYERGRVNLRIKNRDYTGGQKGKKSQANEAHYVL
jgi:hypothetical protein